MQAFCKDQNAHLLLCSSCFVFAHTLNKFYDSKIPVRTISTANGIISSPELHKPIFPDHGSVECTCPLYK